MAKPKDGSKETALVPGVDFDKDTGEVLAKHSDDLLAQYGFDIAQVVSQVSERDFQFAKDQGLIGERLLILKAGDVFRGQFIGEGTPHEMINRRTNQIEPLKTWLFRHANGMHVKILSTFQLDREMPNVRVGQLVQLIHGGSKETNNGNRVNDILVQFARPNPLDAAKQDPNVIEVEAKVN